MTNTNTSASGGYLLPAEPPPVPIPNHQTFTQFLQQVFVGISGLPGPLVRPKWQPNPPTQPDPNTTWMAIGLAETNADTFAYDDVDSEGTNTFMRMEAMTVGSSFYGPFAYELAQEVRDGFQIPQNMEALKSANMGFVSTAKIMRVPDLVNEKWIDRYEMDVFLRREIRRVYPILNFASANGTLYALGSAGVKTLAINVEG